MATTSIRFANYNEEPIYVQVDPWAGLYRLDKDEGIEIVAESETDAPRFSVAEHGTTRILMIDDSQEYFVVRNGNRVHWTDYQHN
jgi:hypothetical protein